MSRKTRIILAALCLAGLAVCLSAADNSGSGGNKRLDLTLYHNVGNIWLRVSNYGFFGSGGDITPRYPSLEYPGGSGIDYLYRGSLWFGAKKYRRDEAGRKLFWRAQHPSADSTQTVAEGTSDWQPWMKPVVDTLVSVGFDGEWAIYEMLPAYNPLVAGNPDAVNLYELWNSSDQIAVASTRQQRRGMDDDGDGIVDEDFVGYTFPLRAASELPVQFQSFGGQYIAQTNNLPVIEEGYNIEIWFPLGFMDLSDRSFPNYAFAVPHDDDGDGLIDEDGAPVSEQDFISYFYDYCPFGTPGDRDLGSNRGMSRHYPLGVRARQMSYQWSYDYIKNMVYVEFNVTNMNIATQDTLFDCAMGIYMDCDCGPQVWSSDKVLDDVSGYVKGENYEFAYTYDLDGDGGLTPGLIGARVCTPDPEQLRFHCWYWEGNQGPWDSEPLSFNFAPRRTANEKYWLLTGRNADESRFLPLRPEQDDLMEYVQPSPNDTRFLFAFYGAQPGTPEYNEIQDGVYYKRWNLAPGRTMKIVVAVFPGDNKEDLKRTARWAKEIYGEAQTLVTVVLPDTFPHYNPPEPPEIPKLFAELRADGSAIDLYWDNRSEFSYDFKTVSSAIIGWQNPDSQFFKPFLDSDPTFVDWSGFPPEFQPPSDPSLFNMNALVNPYTASRLRHDFQGYSAWGRSASGSQEEWMLADKWDKIETQRDRDDYLVNYDSPHADSLYLDFGGYLGIDKGLPNPNAWPESAQYSDFYAYDENYRLAPNPPDSFYGFPIYDPDMDYGPEILAAAQAIADAFAGLPSEEILRLQARLFRHPQLRPEIFDTLLDSKLIPLHGHGGQAFLDDPEALELMRKKRLARRYYHSAILHPRKGHEYYVAVTAYDRGIPTNDLNFLETGRDADANMLVFFPGTAAREDMDKIYVVPNPYLGRSNFDGRRENDSKGDKSRRLWFINLPERCVIRIYTLAGDLVKEIAHDGAYQADVLTISKAASAGLAPSGMHDWDLLSRHRQIIAPGVYLYAVENKANGKTRVGKFVIIK
ncbi:MAG: hypothetical protein K0B87_04885 [Candidatus Syntrophosphaera sp.]|nr:hypothetical protein [Candidatus Syntrophosphaera sp.]